MTGAQAEDWTAPAIDRIDEPFVADERAMLEGWLDVHRTTLLHKCAGLTGEQLATRSAPPSGLSLLGLVRHMVNVERAWFRQRFLGEAVADAYPKVDGRHTAFEDLDPARAAEDLAALRTEWDFCRVAIAEIPYDRTFYFDRFGADVSLRWIVVHMIEEYARHNGHADLIRERIDGVTGT